MPESWIRPETRRLFNSIFETLDQDVSTCFNYVEPTTENVGPNAREIEIFSVELYRLHLDICSALGALLHQWYLKLGDGSKDNPSIGDYYPLLSLPETDIKVDWELELKRNPDIRIQPLQAWAANAPPPWWTDHNKTKHGLSASVFPKASLSNVVYSLGAFYLVAHDKFLRETNPIAPKTFKPRF